MITPDPEAMELAAEWLETYEAEPGGEDVEQAVKHVATWLRQHSRDTEIRRVARQVGCTVSYARKYLSNEGQADG